MEANSYVNYDEIDISDQVYQKLFRLLDKTKSVYRQKIGFITPYK